MALETVLMPGGLKDEPAVVTLATRLCVSVQTIIGCLYTLWEIATLTGDGILHGYSAEILDAKVSLSGFTLLLNELGWLHVRASSLEIPHFDRQFGQRVKQRILNTARQQRLRALSRATSATVARDKRDSSATVARDNVTGDRLPTYDEKEVKTGKIARNERICISRGEERDLFSPLPEEENARDEPPPLKKTRRPKRQPLADPSFLAFWAAYPKKISKGDAEQSWLAIAPSPELTATIMAAVEAHKRHPSWADLQYVPYPASWLNKRGWENVLDTTAGVTKNGQQPQQQSLRYNAVRDASQRLGGT